MALNRFDPLLRASRQPLIFHFVRAILLHQRRRNRQARCALGVSIRSNAKKILENLAQLTDTLLQSGAIAVQIWVYWVQHNVRVDPPQRQRNAS